MSGPLFLGLDIGTSGLRTTVIDRAGGTVSEARVDLGRRDHPDGGSDAEAWWQAARTVLARQAATIGEAARGLNAMAIDATSGSMVATDADGRPLGGTLMYDSTGFDAEAERIAPHAPPGSIARGPGSALARAMRLLRDAPEGARVVHQADFVVGRLTGRRGVSDESNALKTGWDAEERCWPDWIAATGLPVEALPRVVPVGTPIAPIDPDIAAAIGLPESLRVVAGATDSVAAFLAAGSRAPGTAVTSLGSTIALKIVSPCRIEDAARGVYSHRIGEDWLAGGASNAGGRVLLRHFDAATIERLSARIDPDRPTGLDYLPLPSPGERFPVSDPGLAPQLDPRPDDDTTFLQVMLEGMARIERDGYRALADLGAPYPTRVLTAGGGARNEVWRRIRERALGVPVAALERAEASLGMALLARDAVS